jgi:hypothetical protein
MFWSFPVGREWPHPVFVITAETRSESPDLERSARSAMATAEPVAEAEAVVERDPAAEEEPPEALPGTYTSWLKEWSATRARTGPR